MFVKYQHIERFGTTETQNIEFGECYVFPKIDGTNSSVWIEDGQIRCGSRTRELSTESDNAGFYAWAIQQESLLNYLQENPTHRLFGEWLVPHSLRTYRDDAWRNFYVFDVMDGDTYVHYEQYKPLVEKHGINFIPPIAIITNGSYEQFVQKLETNVFLIEDGKGSGEGIVIKRYDYRNNFGRQTWAKIVTSEFKEKHAKVMGAPRVEGEKMVEQEIAKEFVTKALVEKEHAKIEQESGWSSKSIPRLLNTVFYCVVNEELWNAIKKHKNPTINFKTLQYFVFAEVKAKKPELF